MLTLIFIILMFTIFGKLLCLAMRATWGIARILVSFVLFPIVLLGLVVGGLVYLALPILIIAGIVVFLSNPKH
ncbi:MAG: hypothetical protein Q4D60_03525 [Eubacteriales bacterium]|nr:hypothetical protein [Eubacteriales bacterium]